MAIILTVGAGSGLGAGALAGALLPSAAVVDEVLSAPGAVAVDEHATTTKPMAVSRIPVNTFFIEILLLIFTVA
jgi:hypothetical protein